MDKFEQILMKYWGFPRFRPLQAEIIKSVTDGKDTLALMPTGGGKSVTFQISSLAQEGICIVITPLIALMKDQVENLKKKDIKALAIYSGMSSNEIDIALDNCIYGNFKFLYVSPERLLTDIFRERVQYMNVNLIAVDEAHCISQWGYDFRPSYLEIARLRELLPESPVLALTATATQDVIEDIQDKLHFKENNVLSKSFERNNLIYLVREVDDKRKYMLETLKKSKGSGIVYVRTRKRAKEIGLLLRKEKLSADYYHAGLKPETRIKKQDEWQSGKNKIMIATNAFGMGIDKPDVRYVIHYDLPDNIESYFQEAGRAGRDEKRAVAVLLYNNSDKLRAEKRIETQFPEIPTIKNIYNAICNYFQIPVGGGKLITYDFNIADFCSQYKYNILIAHNAIKILEKEGYIDYNDDPDTKSRIHFLVKRDDLYKFQVANAKFDGFIKLLLRTYSGLFSDYIAIDETMLANRVKLNLKDIYGYLNNLNKLGVINYIPRRQESIIVFTEERLDEKNLSISKENYEFRKKRFIERLDAIINYASSRNKCRSQILLQYFGEKDAQRCGACDVCTKRNELNLSKYEFDLVLKEIKDILLKSGSMHQDEVIDKIKTAEDKTIKVIQWLIDNNKIIIDKSYQLSWNKKKY